MSDHADDRDAFWSAVDSSGPYFRAHDRPDECLARLSDGAPCHRPAQEGWCLFHYERLVEYVLGCNADRMAAFARRRDPEAFRFVVDAARLEDANKVLLASNSQVYFIACDGFVKIGYSINPAARLQQIKQGRRAATKTLAPEGIDLTTAVIVGAIPGGQSVETRLHSLLSSYRRVGEWFRITPTVIQAIDFLVFDATPPRAIEKGLLELFGASSGVGRRSSRAAA